MLVTPIFYIILCLITFHLAKWHQKVRSLINAGPEWNVSLAYSRSSDQGGCTKSPES